jgi:hypothetical protein
MIPTSEIKGNFRKSNFVVKDTSHITKHDTPNGRFYEVRPGVYYPSVTTILKPSASLAKWKAEVGEEEAEKRRHFGAARGTTMHNLLETYLANETIRLNGTPPGVKFSFLNAVELLNHIDEIHFSEHILYSDTLKLAGQCDLFAKLWGTDSIIDFKTSSKPKKKEWITNYFCQETAYSLMLKELYGIWPKQIVTIIFVDDVPEPQVFIENPDDYVQLLNIHIEDFKGEFIHA